MLPQWDFLNFLAGRAAQYDGFDLRMEADVTELLYDNNDVVMGLVARTPNGDLEVRADLVIGCDGRTSVVRQQADLTVKNLGAPMDVFWFRLSRRPTDPTQPLLRIEAGRFVVLLGRPEHWQCGYVIPKGGAESMRRRGLAALRQEIVASVPFLADRVDEIESWETTPLLSVRVDRLDRWYREGLLCIGDAAHAMSPVGGVGINLAIQDAVATANLLAPHLRDGRLSVDDLRRVQRRRSWPTRATQRLQVVAANRALRPVLNRNGNPARLAARLLKRVPPLAHLTGRMIGLGLRAEHIRHLEP